MIGFQLKKYATEKGLTVGKGMAYGVYRGYMMTLSEGMGWKEAVFAVQLNEDAVKMELRRLAGQNELKQYAIRQFIVEDRQIRVVFSDRLGFFAKMVEFIDKICDKLTECSVPGAAYCNTCGRLLSEEPSATALVDGRAVLVHESCLSEYNQANVAAQGPAAQGSIGMGLLGALLGGLVGAIPWFIAYCLGWYVALFGLLIGLGAKKGYELLHGRESVAKAIIVILATVFAVFIMEVLSCVAYWMLDPEFAEYGLSFLDVFVAFFQLLGQDAEFRVAVLVDLLVGVIFAGVGIFALARDLFSVHAKNRNTMVKL